MGFFFYRRLLCFISQCFGQAESERQSKRRRREREKKERNSFNEYCRENEKDKQIYHPATFIETDRITQHCQHVYDLYFEPHMNYHENYERFNYRNDLLHILEIAVCIDGSL